MISEREKKKAGGLPAFFKSMLLLSTATAITAFATATAAFAGRNGESGTARAKVDIVDID